MGYSLVLGTGLEYMDAIFRTIRESGFAQYTIVGAKALGVALFLANLIKGYVEGAAEREGVSWGLRPRDLLRNLAFVLAMLHAPEILGLLDGLLVALESAFTETAPALLPLSIQEFAIDEEPVFWEVAEKVWALVYEAFSSPVFGIKMFSFGFALTLWAIDLFLYPLFLAERFFILGVLQVFFPLVMALAVFERFRGMAYSFFRLYIGVYMLVPAFFLVNIFINALYRAINSGFWEALWGEPAEGTIIRTLLEATSIGFIVVLKFRLYKRAITFTLRLFTS
ncbi:hypothetical protein [Sediminicola luteus]|uniref:Uncharacterized protein n=1 Tax=Sediminicola luteus TaxID=319238 RepID=A0A2A4G4U6_9FLAO|nr:hypothetical protein [Sediminicola luteus]PCE63008.1 hypothetical protein B7P33_17185 [Sediminicola luteus]